MESYNKSRPFSILQDFTVQRRDVNSFLHDDPHDGSTLTGGTNTFVGSKCPQWRDIIHNGGNATTAYSGSDHIVKMDWMNAFTATSCIYNTGQTLYAPGWRRLRWMYGRYFPPGIVLPPNPPSSVVTRVTNRCIRNFINRCDSVRSSFEAGQDLGEYKATVHSIEHPMQSLVDLTTSYLEKLKKAKSRYRGRPRSIAQVLADSYLEWHFGIKPLIEDVASAVVDAGRFRFPIYPVSAKASERYSFVDTRLDVTPPLLGFNLRYKTQSYGVFTVRYKGGIRSGADDQGNISVAQAWQLYPRNWLPTAWDLLPWTWLTDYFVNVGDIIRGFSFIMSDLSWGCKTTHTELTRTAVLADVSDIPPPGLPGETVVQRERYVLGGNVEYTIRSVARDVLSGSDFIPGLEFSFPNRGSQFANMAAVLAQRYLGLTPLF